MCIHIINISKENGTDRVNGSFKQYEQKQIFLLTAELHSSRLEQQGWSKILGHHFIRDCYLRRDWRERRPLSITP